MEKFPERDKLLRELKQNQGPLSIMDIERMIQETEELIEKARYKDN